MIGGGPVPVGVVRAAAVDAFVKVVVRDGTKLDTIVHYGRTIPTELRTALELGDPQRLDGAVCIEDGCDRRYGLELDHDDPVANGGAVQLREPEVQVRTRPLGQDRTRPQSRPPRRSPGRAWRRDRRRR